MAICAACKGRKKIEGLGFMGETDCKRCKGTGIEPLGDPPKTATIPTLEGGTIVIPVIGKIPPARVEVVPALHVTETHEEVLAKMAEDAEPEETKPEGFFKRVSNKKSKSQTSN